MWIDNFTNPLSCHNTLSTTVCLKFKCEDYFRFQNSRDVHNWVLPKPNWTWEFIKSSKLQFQVDGCAENAKRSEKLCEHCLFIIKFYFEIVLLKHVWDMLVEKTNISIGCGVVKTFPFSILNFARNRDSFGLQNFIQSIFE